MLWWLGIETCSEQHPNYVHASMQHESIKRTERNEDGIIHLHFFCRVGSYHAIPLRFLHSPYQSWLLRWCLAGQRTKRCHLLILQCREPFRQEHRNWLFRCCRDRRCWRNHWRIGWRWRGLVIDKVLGIRCTSFGYQSARLWVLCQVSTSVAATV